MDLEQRMANTASFTVSVDRDLLHRADVLAAKSGTTIDALFNAQLRFLVETFESAEAGNNQNFRTLIDYSLGRSEVAEVMSTLGIESQEDLFLLMAQARLPAPRLPDRQIDDMVLHLKSLPTK